jgi:hypothetical protein
MTIGAAKAVAVAVAVAVLRNVRREVFEGRATLVMVFMIVGWSLVVLPRFRLAGAEEARYLTVTGRGKSRTK